MEVVEPQAGLQERRDDLAEAVRPLVGGVGEVGLGLGVGASLFELERFVAEEPAGA